MTKSAKVPVQKGPINPNPMTLKQMTHQQRSVDRKAELDGVKDGQTLRLKVPKQ